jgi:glyoxylase-like metal-dependent hydrolase (beta-lactamase superfamily II)
VDLPGSDPDAMFRSLRRLAELPPETQVYPGHNYGPRPTSTIADERRYNPYLRVESPEQWREMMGAG